ncbi:hypothetical protein D3C74_389520 [compost metagenome]
MNSEFKPYYSVDKYVYFTDGAEEILIHEFDTRNRADLVSALLNDAYNHAYQDGLNASINASHSELVNKVMSLSVENKKLKKQLKLE